MVATLPPAAAAIAANRFGLGVAGGETPPRDPQSWLLGQFGRFDVRPKIIADAPGSAVMAAQFREYLAQIRPALAANGFGPAALRPAAPAPAAAAIMAMAGDEPAAGTPRNDLAASIRKHLRQQYRDGYGAQVRARIVAALTTETPFVERLVHFWANHL